MSKIIEQNTKISKKIQKNSCMSIRNGIEYQIIVPPEHFLDHTEYIEKQIKHKLEGKIFSYDIGYLHEITKFTEIVYKRMEILHGIIGSLVFDVKFDARCTMPKIGNIITCKIDSITQDSDVIISFGKPEEDNPMRVLIANPDDVDISHVKIGTIVNTVFVEVTGFNFKTNVIKISASITD